MLHLRRLALPLLLVTATLGGCQPEADDAGEDVATETGESTDTADTSTDAGDTSTDAVDTTGTDTTGTDATTETTDATDTTGGACSPFGDASSQMIIAAASAGEAATAPVVPDGQTVYMITLPEGAAGFVQLQIAEWETTQVFYTVDAIDYEITTDANGQVLAAREPDATCPDAGITRQSIFFPHWTPALIEFSATGPREIPLMVVQQ